MTRSNFLARLACLLVVGICATPTVAGQLPPTMAPPRTATPAWEQPRAAYFTWTGGYIGLQGGGAPSPR